MSDDPNFRCTIAIDDDKVHFEWKRFTNTKGLKQCRHTKANARGFALHTAGFPLSSTVIQVGFMQEGDTETSCHQRTLGSLFGIFEGSNNRPRIKNAGFLSNRGHWVIELLFNCVLPAEADPMGTPMRNGWCPFTCDKAGSELPDKPENLSVQGCKDAHFKSV